MYNIQKAWWSFCLFYDYWFETINYNMHYTRVLQMSCMWIKDGLHFKVDSGQFNGLTTELPAVSILESSGLPTELPIISVYGSSGKPYLHGKIPTGSPLCYPLFPYMRVVGSLICMAKFPWADHLHPTPLPTELPTFSYLEEVGCPLSLLFPYMGEVGSLICIAKFPRAAHSVAHMQRSGQLPFFSVCEHSLLQCDPGISAVNME